MSLVGWLKRGFSSSTPAAAASGGKRVATAPGGLPAAGPRAARAQPTPSDDSALARRNERTQRREQLYTVVRDTMVRMSVLSSGYKFKVLSLDQAGLQFLIMIDLAAEYGKNMAQLSQIESSIAHAARARVGVHVAAIYWRISETMIGAAPASSKGQSEDVDAAPFDSSARTTAPAPLSGASSGFGALPKAAALGTAVAPAAEAASSTNRRFEPIEADEVAAFRRALVAASASRQTGEAPPARSRSSIASSLPPGFEDTEMTGYPRSSGLSNTQYGEL